MTFFFILIHHIDLFRTLRHLFGTFKVILRLFTAHCVVYLECYLQMWKMISAFLYL